MANVPLKSITFPGLSDTYTVPQIDANLTASGKAADAKVTGDSFNEFVEVAATPSSNKVHILVAPNSSTIDLATQDEVDELKNDLTLIENAGFTVTRNLFYEHPSWTLYDCEISYSENSIILTSNKTTTGNAYQSAQIDFDVSNIDAMTISYNSITGDTGTNPRIRYGRVTNGTATWIGFTNGTTVIDTTTFDTLRISLYLYFNKPATTNSIATFNMLQIQEGGTATDFTKTLIATRKKIGDGNTGYYGEQITLIADTNYYMCNIDIWKNFTNTSEYTLRESQSIAIWGNYLFIFKNGGGVVILNKTTKVIIATATIDVSSNHANSAQFTDIYYDSSDEFPVLLLSRCGNSETSSQSPNTGTDACLVMRITKDLSENFTFTLLGTVKLDVTTFGTSWCVDNVKGRIYVACYRNGTYHITVDNPVYLYGFDMPSNIITSNNTLSVANAVISVELDYFVLQSIFAVGGNIFIVSQDNANYIFNVDTKRGLIASKIPVDNTMEAEGICVDDGTMYLMARKGSDTSETNSCKIYSITF